MRVRGSCELYQAINEGRHPWPDGQVGSLQWAPLLGPEYLPQAPRNMLSPEPVASRLVEVMVPGADGTSVDPSSAGWVWNSADKQRYAAGGAD